MLQWLLFLVFRIEILCRLVEMANAKRRIASDEIPGLAVSVRPGEIGLVVMAEMDAAVFAHHTDAVWHEHRSPAGRVGIGGHGAVAEHDDGRWLSDGFRSCPTVADAQIGFTNCGAPGKAVVADSSGAGGCFLATAYVRLPQGAQKRDVADVCMDETAGREIVCETAVASCSGSVEPLVVVGNRAEIFIVIGVHDVAERELPQVARAGDLPCLASRLTESGKKHGRQNGDDGDDDKQFDKRERAPSAKAMVFH